MSLAKCKYRPVNFVQVAFSSHDPHCIGWARRVRVVSSLNMKALRPTSMGIAPLPITLSSDASRLSTTGSTRGTWLRSYNQTRCFVSTPPHLALRYSATQAPMAVMRQVLAAETQREVLRSIPQVSFFLLHSSFCLSKRSPCPGVGIDSWVSSGAEQAGLEVNHNGGIAPHRPCLRRLQFVASGD